MEEKSQRQHIIQTKRFTSHNDKSNTHCNSIHTAPLPLLIEQGQRSAAKRDGHRHFSQRVDPARHVLGSKLEERLPLPQRGEARTSARNSTRSSLDRGRRGSRRGTCSRSICRSRFALVSPCHGARCSSRGYAMSRSSGAANIRQRGNMPNSHHQPSSRWKVTILDGKGQPFIPPESGRQARNRLNHKRSLEKTTGKHNSLDIVGRETAIRSYLRGRDGL